MRKNRLYSSAPPLFASRLTSFQQVDWPVVMESHGFQYIGLCTDRDRPGCYGKPYIVDELAAPLQGLPFLLPFRDPKDQELNQLLHQLQFTEQLPYRAAALMLPAEVEFLTAWVPTRMPAAFFGSYYDSTLVQRRAMFLRECIGGSTPARRPTSASRPATGPSRAASGGLRWMPSARKTGCGGRGYGAKPGASLPSSPLRSSTSSAPPPKFTGTYLKYTRVV